MGLSGVILSFIDTIYALQYGGETSAGFKLDLADVCPEGMILTLRRCLLSKR